MEIKISRLIIISINIVSFNQIASKKFICIEISFVELCLTSKLIAINNNVFIIE